MQKECKKKEIDQYFLNIDKNQKMKRSWKKKFVQKFVSKKLAVPGFLECRVSFKSHSCFGQIDAFFTIFGLLAHLRIMFG